MLAGFASGVVRLGGGALGPVGLPFRMGRLACALPRLALSVLDAAAGLGDRAGLRLRLRLRLRRGRPALRRRRRHPREHLEPERLDLLGETARSQEEARSLVKGGGIECLGDPVHDRVADGAAFVRKDVASKLRERPDRTALLVEALLQVAAALPGERLLLSLA